MPAEGRRGHPGFEYHPDFTAMALASTHFIRLCSRVATALVVTLVLAAPAAASGWEMLQFDSPLGDRAIGLVVPAQNAAGVFLAIGCDGVRGDRWRGVLVFQDPGSKHPLGRDHTVRVRFGKT